MVSGLGVQVVWEVLVGEFLSLQLLRNIISSELMDSS